MMLSSAVRAYVCAAPVDMRRSIDALARMVEPVFAQDPFSGHVFVFVGRSRDKVKLLVYDRTGFWLMYKRLERGRFTDPARLAKDGMAMTELMSWIDGIDVSRARRIAPVAATRVS